MKYYRELAPLEVFNHEEALKIIGSLENTNKTLNRMVKNNYIKRVKKDLYSVIDFNTLSDYGNHYKIASKIDNDSAIAYHSAFEYYACYNQLYYDVQVLSTKRFSEFTYNGYHYCSFLNKLHNQIDVINGVRVTSIERTIVDSINMLGKVMDLEELIKCLDLVAYVNEDKIIEMLELYNKELLYKKVGYILSFYKKDFNLTNNFFNQCKEKMKSNNHGKLLYINDEKLVYNSEWRLYVVNDLRKLINKGGFNV